MSPDLPPLTRAWGILRDAFSRAGPAAGHPDPIGRARYVRAARTALASGLNTFLAVVVGILMVALTVRYLGKERYGLWLTISTLQAWLYLGDFGVVNALTNRLAESDGRGERDAARGLVSSAFFFFVAVGVLIAAGGVWLGIAVPWDKVFNVRSAVGVSELPVAIALSFALYGIGFPLNITRSVYDGYQEGYYAHAWNIAGNLASVLALVAATRFDGGLPLLVAAVFGTRQLVAAASAVFLFAVHRPWLLPSPRRVRGADVRSLLSIGILFIVLQVAYLLVSETDNLVLVRYLGPDAVAVYGTAWKLFNYVALVQLWFLRPLWPAYGEAYARGDAGWISRTLRMSLLGLLILTAGLVAALALLAQPIIRVWAGPALVPGAVLVLGLAALQLMRAWNEPFVFFLNGISRLKGQSVYILAGALLAFGLKIALAPRWGGVGVIAATLVSYLLFNAWLLPLDAWGALRALRRRSGATSELPV